MTSPTGTRTLTLDLSLCQSKIWLTNAPSLSRCLTLLHCSSFVSGGYQCDHMVRLICQYLVIYNDENLPKSI